MGSGSSFYIIQQNNRLLTVQTVKNPIVLASKNQQKIKSLVNTLQNHKEIHNKWINQSRMCTSDTLFLVENTSRFKDNKIEASKFDFEDPKDAYDIVKMYHFQKLRIFLVDDFQFDSNLPMLTLNGYLLEDKHLITSQWDLVNKIDLRDYLDSMVWN